MTTTTTPTSSSKIPVQVWPCWHILTYPVVAQAQQLLAMEVESIRVERDFYFDTLRSVEVLRAPMATDGAGVSMGAEELHTYEFMRFLT